MTVSRDHDDEYDWDDDEPDSGDDLDEEATVPCPSCGREILEDSPRCPYCERYLSAEDHAGQRKPVWITATALVCLGVAIWWLFTAF
ncbi:MAG: hypothetical protein ACKONH_07535 [Planctomycetia bacterium]